MNNSEIASTLSQNSLRLCSITWLAGGANGFDEFDELADELRFAAEDRPFMHESMSIFKGIPREVLEEEDFFVDWMNEEEIYGFIIQVDTPVPTEFFDDGGCRYSWSLTQGTAIYVENIADVVPVAIEWREKKMAEWRPKAAA